MLNFVEKYVELPYALNKYLYFLIFVSYLVKTKSNNTLSIFHTSLWSRDKRCSCKILRLFYVSQWYISIVIVKDKIFESNFLFLTVTHVDGVGVYCGF